MDAFLADLNDLAADVAGRYGVAATPRLVSDNQPTPYNGLRLPWRVAGSVIQMKS